MRVSLISFAHGKAFEARQALLSNQSNIERYGISDVTSYRLADIQQLPEYRRHADGVFAAEEGAGYWAWKPMIVLERMKTLGDGDCVIYTDASQYHDPRIRFSALPCVRYLEANGMTMIPGVLLYGWDNLRVAQEFVKYYPYEIDFAYASRVLGLPVEDLQGCLHVQASFSVWMKRPETLAFLEELRDLCLDKALHESLPFHDQGITSALCRLRDIRAPMLSRQYTSTERGRLHTALRRLSIRVPVGVSRRIPYLQSRNWMLNGDPIKDLNVMLAHFAYADPPDFLQV